MNQPLILLHEESLRISHPVFSAAGNTTKAIFIWDEAYFCQKDYSFKRLVFIYETLCQLPVDIIQGNTVEVISQLNPSILYIPEANNPELLDLINSLKTIVTTRIIQDEIFSVIKKPYNFKRFFQYWKKAEKSVFLYNAGTNDQIL